MEVVVLAKGTGKKKRKGKTIYLKNGDLVCSSICIGPFPAYLPELKQFSMLQRSVPKMVLSLSKGEQS